MQWFVCVAVVGSLNRQVDHNDSFAACGLRQEKASMVVGGPRRLSTREKAQ